MTKWSAKCLGMFAAKGILAGASLPVSAAETEAMARQYETAQTVKAVVIEAENTDLVIQKGKGNKVQGEGSADPYGTYEYSFALKDGVLSIQVESLEGEEVEDWGFERAIVVSVEGAGKNARTFIWDNQVTVTLPDRLYDRIEVENENGSIEIGEIEVEQISLEGDNGDITLTGTAGNEIAAHTQNGNVVLEEPDGMQYDCTTKNGDIKATLTGTRADYQIATKGKMRLSGLWGDEKDAGTEKIPAKFETENGYIEVHFAG